MSKKLLALLVAVMAFSFTAQESQACDGCLARKAVGVATAPVRLVGAVVQNRPRLFCARTVTVSVPVVKRDCCGRVVATGCSTACVTARFFPGVKARRLARGKSVTALGSASSVTWSQ